jgi:NAD(P)-dependent dehydrogenase (short-subunit alcohol dehydrogenase family)
MDVRDKIVVVTGAARGIGAALAGAVAAAGAARVVCVDQDEGLVGEVADRIGGLAFPCDLAEGAAVRHMIAQVEEDVGPIGLYCSNAGIAPGFAGGIDNPAAAPAAEWAAGWAVNVMAHVHAAAELVPRMRARGGGWILVTVSAAGLLTQIGSAIYATTKHAALGFAENLAVHHFADGIRVAALCPQAVQTPMLTGLGGGGVAGLDGVLSAETVAVAALDGLRAERFLILPHPEVADYAARKAADRDRWIAGMARLQERMFS